ncbi:MAG: GAF domain-containing protein [Symploca sp. SIO2E6]|nr:GAF domain-containing protein [Symploca sp. SIO2E6]
MTAASFQTIDVTPEPEPVIRQEQQQSSALVATQGTFSAYLAPLTQDTFKQVVQEVEERFKVVNQTLSMLDSMLESQGFDAILDEMLRSITAKTGELLAAYTTTIFLLDEDKNELWAMVPKKGGGSHEIRIPVEGSSIAAEVATTKRYVNIPYDFFDDPRSGSAKEQYEKTGFRTYTMLALPLLNEQGNLVAVIQLINKLKFPDRLDLPYKDNIDLNGFSTADEQVFEEFAPSIRLILESSRSLKKATQRQQAASALMESVNSLSKASLDLEDTLKKVMDEAKKLMNADRSTLWLIDQERDDLWTKIPINGELTEIRLPVKSNSFAAQVARTGETVNIEFDLYNHPDSEISQETDQKSGYRTCSLLCMPVFNSDGELIGVTQLINKKKQGEFPEYKPENWPRAPECWQASFNRTDQEFMQVFNIQAGVALQNAKLFDTVKQQEQMQRDILRSLSDGVISTDKEGNIIAANESAKELLSLDETTSLEGKKIIEIVRIEDKDKQSSGKFAKWLNEALEGQNPKAYQQYYPDQNLSCQGAAQPRSVNLSINTMADASDRSKVRGALVVMEDISDEKRLKSTMYRYMTQEVAEELLKLGEAKMGGDRKEVSVLFSDIRSYTSLTEKLEAEEVVSMLNEYFESMVDAVFQNKGTLDKYIGDAIMAVFGSPLPLEDHAWRAVKTALEMRQRLVKFNDKRSAQNKEIIRIGIGIHSDSVISGNIGSSKRMEFTAIGDGVNLGSRLEGASKQYGTDIIISENTYQPCVEKIRVRELDYIRVKGKNEPVRIYELVGFKDEPIAEEKQQVIDLYHEGRELYLNRNFPLAMGKFGQVMAIDAGNKAADLHLERCQHWLKNPPPDDWDGGWTLTSK